jgi:hypothetical protein
MKAHHRDRAMSGAQRRGWMVCAALLWFAGAGGAQAYAPLGIGSWPSGEIPIRLRLDATAPTRVFPLMDGSSSWNLVAERALAEWNAVGGRSRFTWSSLASITPEQGDGACDVVFNARPYGMDFPDRALAITYVRPLDGDSDQARLVEADVFVNTAYAWNSYRGPMQIPYDLRRVLLHEFGHALGLDHPNEHQQTLPAIMNSSAAGINNSLSTLEALQADDIAGFNFLYNTPFARPTITTQPASRMVEAGGSARLEIAVDGNPQPATDAFRSTRWYYRPPGATDYEVLFTLHQPGALNFGVAQPLDSGSYQYRVITPDHTVVSEVATLTVNPVASAPTTALANLSTRGWIDSARPMVVGFVVAGTQPKTVLLRGVGFSLARPPFNLPHVADRPRLALRNAAGTTVATSPDVWSTSPSAAAIRDATTRVGAFPLEPQFFDAIVVATLMPGSYTAEVTKGVGDGVVLVEAYDADPTPNPASRLLNLSSRGWVGGGDDAMIAGFVVRGPGPRTYLIRAAGDTMKNFGVSGTLDDPYLRLFRGDGTLVRELDDWDSPRATQAALRAASASVGAFELTDRQECVMLVTLPPGNYTAQVSGWIGPTTVTPPTGIALVEIYEMP